MRMQKVKQKNKQTKNSKKLLQKKSVETKKEAFPHFRKYLKSGHPALIIGEQKVVSEQKKEEHYNYKKVMHSERDGKRLNEKIEPNPNRNDPKPMYIAKSVKHDKKNHFSSWKYNWKYPKKDK